MISCDSPTRVLSAVGLGICGKVWFLFLCLFPLKLTVCILGGPGIGQRSPSGNYLLVARSKLVRSPLAQEGVGGACVTAAGQLSCVGSAGTLSPLNWFSEVFGEKRLPVFPINCIIFSLPFGGSSAHGALEFLLFHSCRT